jgi:hypothetical protein
MAFGFFNQSLFTTLPTALITLGLVGAGIGASSCKTVGSPNETTSTDKSITPPTKTVVPSEPMVIAKPVKDYDTKTLKTNLANAMSEELKNKQLWALFLREQEAGTPCHGTATEVYYFADKGDNNQDGYPVVTAQPMPMNGPCGFVLDTQLKKFNDIGGNLMESTPMGEIGTFDKIRISVKQAIINSERRHKTFKYSQGVKVYRHLHPDMWNFPWYAIYGEACGLSATVIMNASTGEIVPNMESPPTLCPQP